MIFPKLLTNNGQLYAFRGQNQIAWRFGRRIKVCRVKHVIGPIYRRTSSDFFECIDYFQAIRNAEEQSK